jgi:hypothetical protein
MSQSKKFIITEDKSMSDQLIAHGFLLLSNNCGVYTLVNEPHNNFSFDNFDMTKIHFTDKLFI